MKVTKAQIDTFLETRRIAIAGVSTDNKKMGHYIFKELKSQGFDVIPINPKAESIEGVTCYKSIEDLPNDIDSILITTTKEKSDQLLQSAINKGIKNIWVQNAAKSNNTIQIAQDNQKPIIHSQCILMFANPSGVHNVHRFINKLIKIYPN